MPKKESGAQGRKWRAQFEVFLNESRKFMKKNFKSSGYAKRQSADIRRQDESAGTDNHRIVKHRGRKIFVCPGAQDTLATPLTRCTGIYVGQLLMGLGSTLLYVYILFSTNLVSVTYNSLTCN